MVIKRRSAMEWCCCFGFFSSTKKKNSMNNLYLGIHIWQEPLLNEELEVEEEDDMENCSYNGVVTDIGCETDEFRSPAKSSKDIFVYRTENGLICREFPIKETHKLVRSEDECGNKMVNEYVRECKIGGGSFGKVVLYRSQVDGKHYAIKAFHKSRLLKQRVAPSETAMSDVLREVLIMKMLNHPNLVNLIEVIDDPTTDHFYMVLEYVEGKCVCDGSDRLGESTARKYLRDIVSGLTYLHSHNVVHGDIKPSNLLITASGTVKIGDFGVSQVFEDENDELRRSPGTPAFTAPECCSGLTYHGKANDIWAVGVTLYRMILGKYPYIGETIQDTFDKIVNDPLIIPEGINPLLKNLIEGLLCKDPAQRMNLETLSTHSWVVGEDGPVPTYFCWCKRNRLQSGKSDERVN